METQVLRYLVGGSNFEELMKRGMSESAGAHSPYTFLTLSRGSSQLGSSSLRGRAKYGSCGVEVKVYISMI